ncbi:Trimethylguanosine synthase [Mortierella polycephala]|uniref:Trimethylguanosine synthase n=1 Tax=Mortierella polycephala TaxID=41804 RepID=A0A9P6U8P2_9FUNG|nr:Trimethylguanosine synthase [Mortierella polycephala]
MARSKTKTRELALAGRGLLTTDTVSETKTLSKRQQRKAEMRMARREARQAKKSKKEAKSDSGTTSRLTHVSSSQDDNEGDSEDDGPPEVVPIIKNKSTSAPTVEIMSESTALSKEDQKIQALFQAIGARKKIQLDSVMPVPPGVLNEPKKDKKKKKKKKMNKQEQEQVEKAAEETIETQEHVSNAVEPEQEPESESASEALLAQSLGHTLTMGTKRKHVDEQEDKEQHTDDTMTQKSVVGVIDAEESVESVESPERKRIKLDSQHSYDQLQSSESSISRRVNYTHGNQLPEDMRKYWHQRYRYFSQYDQGIKMDKEGWYSVTPEKIAAHIAERCASDIIIDAFCGVGGNSIQFAMTCHRVIAIDIDPVRLRCAKHNAKIYGVEDRIEFIQGDYMTLIPRLKADVVFLSPPWGGPGYLAQDEFDIKRDIPMDGEFLFNETCKITKNIAYFLPRNSNAEQIGRLVGEDGNCEIEKNVLNKVCKAWTAYFGELATPGYEEDEEAQNEHPKDAIDYYCEDE